MRGRRKGPGPVPRRMPLRKSLLGRLLAVSALVAACSVAATAWIAVQTTSGAIKQQQGQNFTDDARIYDTLLGHAATRPQWGGVQKTVRDLARKYDRRIALTTPDRVPIADSATGPKPPALPAKRSAVVDPLATETLLDPTSAGYGGDTADRIDPRAVGPFRLTPAERDELRGTADRVQTCLRRWNIDADVVPTPSGRPYVRVVGGESDSVQRSPCRSDGLSGPTRTERTALGALNRLTDDCLKRQDGQAVRLALDLVSEREIRIVRADGSPITIGGLYVGPTAVGSAPGPFLVETVPTPAPAREKAGADRAVATCVDSARREQLAPYVSPAALLFIGDSSTPTVPGFELSPRNTARIAGAAALVLALTVGASVLAATRLVRPLRALTGAAQRLKDGGSAEPVPVGPDNEIGRLAAAFNDMAAHRARLEAQRREMVGDVAHELRTPLSNIRGWLEGAQDGVAEPDPAFVSSLLEEAVQLQHIIDDLQDLAQADADALRLRPEPVRPGELLGQVAAAHQVSADSSGVTLTVSVPAGAPSLTADPVRLRQAVGNLVSNAVRHTPPGGTVTLRAYGSGDGEDTGRHVVLEVADTGAGIPPGDLPHVFDRFWRAEKSRSRRTGGSGLGLAIVRKLAEAHGGSAQARSTVGEGSVFTLRLPVEGPVGPGDRPPEGPVGPAGGAPEGRVGPADRPPPSSP
ncbi:sensor histidine kinase [Streptomyces sp. NPDC051018]|uniref:sensor histidine kinase n=1 Tax=Streptomyces sp. NPDC051018 TaxID=3365639 RepID=UPI00379B1D12